MTTPDVPLRVELTVEVQGTPAQVWEALATANGVTAWFVPTDLEERAGGHIAFHMGETSSHGHITRWEPPERIVYEEPDWAALAGHDDAEVTPLATEMIVEARSGGTCVVRVVSSAFGTGADWEQEFFDGMVQGWAPFFEHLRLYLARYAGQEVTSLTADASIPGSFESVQDAMRRSLGIEAEGQPFSVRGLRGRVLDNGKDRLLVELDDPLPGYLAFMTYDTGTGTVMAQFVGYLFSPDAPLYVESEQAGWREWLTSLRS